MTRISDNLELQLRDLHIRFQVHISMYAPCVVFFFLCGCYRAKDDSPAVGGPPVSGGLHLASLEVQSTGAGEHVTVAKR